MGAYDVTTIPLIKSAAAIGAGDSFEGTTKTKTYQASGRVSASTGAAVIAIQGSNNGGVSWDTIGTITLALTASGGTNDASDSFTSRDRYKAIRANVTTLSGTNAAVQVTAGY